jgi:hypothetical protein
VHFHEVIVMKHDVDLSCRCGAVHGVVADVASNSVNRIVCYCFDCQAFVHQLRRSDLLDAHGGSDIVQVAPGRVRIDRGAENVCALRLSDKGMFRFYASCCNTPLGNSAGTKVPFLGIAQQAFATGALGGADAVFGAPRFLVYGKHAVGTPPEGSTKLNPMLFVRVLGAMLGWALRGVSGPNPYFESRTGESKYPVLTLSSAERESLRPLCGPRAV